VRYEYPFNEGIRTMLRLEQLFDRLGVLVPRDTAVDHHYAIATIFEIMDVASRADLLQWISTLMPLAEALRVLLGLLRDSGVPHNVAAIGGQYQQSLPAGRVYQLLRVRIDPAEQLVPEISGHRLMVSVRLMRQEADGRLKPTNADASFELTLCA
jgi:cell division protein ZapD